MDRRNLIIDKTENGIGTIITDISNINYNWNIIVHEFYIYNDSKYFILESNFSIYEKK